MTNNDNAYKNSSEYEPLHNPTIVNDRLNPISVIMPIFVIIIIICAMSIYTYLQTQHMVDDIEQVTNQMEEYIAGNISNDIDYAESSIKLASYSVSQSMTSDTLSEPARVIRPLTANTPFHGIEYITADGMNIMNIGDPFDASDRVYYIEGIRGYSGIWNNYHPKMAKETLMNFYTPIIYEGKVSGVLTGYIAATTQLTPLFEKKLYDQDIYGILVDENDMVICSTIESDYIQDLSLDVFMDHFNANEEQKAMVHKIVNNSTEEASFYEDEARGGRICVATIPNTDWKVVILIPKSSFNAIISTHIRRSVITIFIITFVLVSYAAFVLLKNINRRKEIGKLNTKLEAENRIFDEENKRAFKEISAIRDIIASANMGTWRIELVDDVAPRMYVDDTMKNLLGVSDEDLTPEETYNDWYSNIKPEAVASVLTSVVKMEQGHFDENTYLWIHPVKGERYVRCGGTAKEIPGGYLLSGYHYDVDEVVRDDLAKVEMLQEALNEKNDYYNTLGTLANVYNSLHVIDLVDDIIIEFSAKEKFSDIVDHKRGATEKVIQAIKAVTEDEYLDRALEFTDLTTIPERLYNKQYISTQLVSKRIGWYLAAFITMDTDADGHPTKVILTTQGIEEEKKQEEKLINKTRTDELTGLLNRRAYEEDIYEQNGIPKHEHFVSMSLDVNGLKVVNDTLGHAAGDELLIGASHCMKMTLGSYGNLYRTGGDEFIAILFCDDVKLKEIIADFDDTIDKWVGKLVSSLTISYGYISNQEEPQLSFRELGAIADKRMYEAKTSYYRKKGIDRRGQQDAHRVLCELYTKILKINITDNTYQIINMDPEIHEEVISENLSTWISEFGNSGQVHPDDLQEFLNKTDLNYMRDYFKSNNLLRIFYRRKFDNDYKYVMMEIIPANDYSETSQSMYLYVKQTDKM